MTDRDLVAEELEQAAYDYWWPVLSREGEMNVIDYNDPAATREAVRLLLLENAKLRAAADAARVAMEDLAAALAELEDTDGC